MATGPQHHSATGPQGYKATGPQGYKATWPKGRKAAGRRHSCKESCCQAMKATTHGPTRQEQGRTAGPASSTSNSGEAVRDDTRARACMLNCNA